MNSQISFFVENRLHHRIGEGVVTSDAAFALGGWARGMRDPESAIVVARVSPESTDDMHPVSCEVRPLSNYEGLKGTLFGFPRAFTQIFRQVRASKTIVVRIPGVIGCAAVLAATLLKRRIVIEVVGDISEVLGSGVGGGFGRLFNPIVTRTMAWAVRRGDAVRYVTSETLQSKYPAPASAVTFAFSDVELRQDDFSFECGETKMPTVVAVGSQEQNYKGHDLLIRVVAHLASRELDVRLTLVGAGKEQVALRKMAAELGVEDRVEFVGHVSSRDEVRKYMASAWVFAMPSRTEGLPRALVEAMALGRACVGTRVGGIPELIPDQWTVDNECHEELGLLIERLIQDGQLRALVGHQAKQKAESLWTAWTQEKVSWERYLADLAHDGSH